MIAIIVLDGLRPDMVTRERMPFLHRMSARGVTCEASHVAFPTATRINSASLTTGCYPGRHGIVDNELYVPALDAEKPVSCADWRALQGMADSEGRRLLDPPTLGEILQTAGKGMVSGGSGSPGTTYLTNPTLTGPVVNWAVAWPTSTEEEVSRRYGGMLGSASSSPERNEFVVRALCEYLIPDYRPDLVTLWLTEPDHTQHAHGLAAPEALATLREVDELLCEYVTCLEREHASQGLTCFVLSDHGFSTVDERVDLRGELVRAGFLAKRDSPDIVSTYNSLFFNGAARERLVDVVRFLREQPWAGGVFLRDDLLDECPGAMPQSAVGGHHRRSAEIMLSYRWSHAPNEHGIPGCVANPGSLAATHGSASPYAIRNTLIAWGAGIKRGIVSQVPCAIVDVAPTVLHILGVAPPRSFEGRVLHEILEDGPDPEALAVTHTAHEATFETPNGPRIQTAHHSHVDGHAYLDQLTLTHESEPG